MATIYILIKHGLESKLVNAALLLKYALFTKFDSSPCLVRMQVVVT